MSVQMNQYSRLPVVPPHFSEAVNRNIVQSELEGGIYLRDVPPGTVLKVETESRSYTLRYMGSGQRFISGHPVFCPEPT